jgi:hypothetical protein
MGSDLLDEARYVYQKKGGYYILKLLPAFVYRRTVRRLLPPTGDSRYDFMRQKYIKKKVFDDYVPSNRWLPGDKNKKRTYKKFHQSITEAGSNVVIIGGGYGISTFYACQSAGRDGHVTVYEASKDQVDIIDDMCKEREVSEQCEIIHGLVGDDINIYGETQSYKQIQINEIRSCDVLELDCEGAELSILESIEISPDHILCEVHGQYLDDPEKTVPILEDLGYEISGYASSSKAPLIDVHKQGIDVYEKISGIDGSAVLWGTLDYD